MNNSNSAAAPQPKPTVQTPAESVHTVLLRPGARIL